MGANEVNLKRQSQNELFGLAGVGILPLQTPMPLITKKAAPTKKGNHSPAPPILIPSLNVAAGEEPLMYLQCSRQQVTRKESSLRTGAPEKLRRLLAAEKPAERV